VGFDPTRYGPLFRYNDTAFSIGANQDKVIANLSAYRVALFIQGFSQSYSARPIVAPVANSGIQIIAGTGPVILTLEAHGPVVQQEWHAMGTAPFNAYVLEVLYQPEGGA